MAKAITPEEKFEAAAKMRAYRAAHPDRIRATRAKRTKAIREEKRRYNLLHKDEIRKHRADRSAALREERNAQKRKWDDAHPEAAIERAKDKKARQKEYDRQRWACNANGIRERSKKRNQEHAEEARQSARRWRLAHIEEDRAYAREYGKKLRAEHPEKAREYNRRNYANNAEARRAYRRKYYQEHREEIAAKQPNLKARRKGAPGSHTPQDIADLFERQGGKCDACKCRLFKSGPKKTHVDHVQPIARGGSNNADNLALLCAPCNMHKNAISSEAWAKELGRLFV